uniref:non-specific serine/threonine protein kinase n=1 Tax=viral metagenome TaxID=1070528 RepID=A0A6C0LAD7_9ZZZZ
MNEKVLGKKYKILDKIGNGKFGIVYRGMNMKSGESVAIKTEKKNSDIRLLKNETTILKYLYDHGSRSSPVVYWYGVDELWSYLVMSYYDISLFDYCNQSPMTPEKIDKIMCVCIDILETIHKNYILHRDIKPQNFMISNEEIFLIDFGFACFYVDDKVEHLPITETQNIVGTPKYVSYHVHDGITNSRRDDLISLGYLYIYLYCRELPWDALLRDTLLRDALKSETVPNGYEEIHILHYKNQQRKEMKSWTKLSEICLRINQKMYDFLNYCYNLRYDGPPDYNALKKLFT